MTMNLSCRRSFVVSKWARDYMSLRGCIPLPNTILARMPRRSHHIKKKKGPAARFVYVARNIYRGVFWIFKHLRCSAPHIYPLSHIIWWPCFYHSRTTNLEGWCAATKWDNTWPNPTRRSTRQRTVQREKMLVGIPCAHAHRHYYPSVGPSKLQ